MLSRPKRNKQTIIDRQILALHTAMADKLLSQPQLFEQVHQVLVQRAENKLISYGSWLMWTGILELKNDPSAFRAALLATDERTAKLRRRTILTGILSEQEREEVLATYIASELR
ncbi:hypothetical protein DXV75_14685 [Alteromonas aestuariivivens]|uniref:Uncharacterized protein n=1 Tax=Alteromonas aestuariivivens TaxID=1938339 RepID=A0A3D8M3Q5_9ALTE|nr:hypothetical protein [Alteromonas aestuariivivens]RDV24261.1 hypothetical protein DXV75_14685 [Alteromonas aestuariivivens]